MKRATRIYLAVLLSITLLGAAVAAEESGGWPQWRGPARDGQAVGFESPARWPEKLARKWRIEVGQGHSGPLVAGDRLFLFVRTEQGEAIESRRVADGSLIWHQAYPTSYPVTPEGRWHGRGPFSTPALVDGVLYTFGIAEVLSAWKAEDGELLWRRDFGREYDTPWAYYGTSLSPIVTAGAVVVHAGGPGKGALVALDAGTGKERWRLEGEGPPYGSAIEAEIGGVRQIVSFTQNRLIGVASASGELLWSVPFKVAWDNTVQTPVVVEDTVVMAAWETPARGFRIEHGSDGFQVEVGWQAPESAIAYTSPVVIGGRVLGFGSGDGGRLYRLDPRTGSIDWRGRPRRGDHASLVAVGTHLLVFTEAGQLEVYQAAGAEPELVASYQVTTSDQWAHPAVFGRSILVKGQGELVLWELPEDDR